MGCMYTVYRMKCNKVDQWLLAECGNHSHNNSLCSLGVSLSSFSHRHLGLSLMLPQPDRVRLRWNRPSRLPLMPSKCYKRGQGAAETERACCVSIYCKSEVFAWFPIPWDRRGSICLPAMRMCRYNESSVEHRAAILPTVRLCLPAAPGWRCVIFKHSVS